VARRYLILFFVFFAALPLSAALGYLALHPDLLGDSYQHRDFTLYERLLTELRVLWDYVSVLLLPSGAKMGLVHDDFVLSRGWLSPATTLMAALSWLGIVAASIFFLGRKIPSVPLGILFFLVAHGVESTILPLEIYFEHRNYLPALGLYLSLVAGLAGAARLLPRGELLLKLLAVTIIPMYLLATHARSNAWSEPTVNLLAALEHHPDSPRLLSGAAELMAATGKGDVALQLTQRAERVSPRQHAAFLLLRYRIACMDERPPAAALYSAMDQIQAPEISQQLTYQFQLLVRMIGSDRCPQAEPERLAGIITLWLERGVKHNMTRVRSVVRYLGELLVIDQRDQAALEQFQTAVKMAPGDQLDRFLLAGQLQQLGRNQEAVEEFLIGESLLREGSREYESMRHVLRYRLRMPPYFTGNIPPEQASADQ
jgi:Tfp pilus assembly protein PilF